jgi:CBS domain containing-hemolysin-like protein
MLCLAPGTPVDRALTELRIRGQRAAVVGTPQAPRGLVTLKDLLEEISGDLGTW